MPARDDLGGALRRAAHQVRRRWVRGTRTPELRRLLLEMGLFAALLTLAFALGFVFMIVAAE